MHHPRQDNTYHGLVDVTPDVEHCLEREIAQWVHPIKDRSDDPSHHERTLYLCATSRSLAVIDAAVSRLVRHIVFLAASHAPVVSILRHVLLNGVFGLHAVTSLLAAWSN